MKKIIVCAILVLSSIGNEVLAVDFPINCKITYMGATASGNNVKNIVLGKQNFTDGSGFRYTNAYMTRLGDGQNPFFAVARLIENLDTSPQLLIQIGTVENQGDIPKFKLKGILGSKQVEAIEGISANIATGVGTIVCTHEQN